MRRFAMALGICAALNCFPTQAKALRMIAPVAGNAGQPGPTADGKDVQVTLPYSINQGGGQWIFYQNGAFRQQSNMPLYSQGAMPTVNGNYLNANNGHIDGKTGEFVMELVGQGLNITRRVMFLKDEGVMRIIDVVKNTGNADAQAALAIQTQINYGVQSAQTVDDPKGKGQQIGWVAQTSANRAVLEMFAGHAAKVAPSIQYQQGNNFVQGAVTLNIPPGKEVALMHLHGTMAGSDGAARWMAEVKDAKLMAGVSPAIRKLIVNFRVGVTFVGEVEVLRGEALDIVEIKGGDQLRGTLKEEKYNLKTFYGPVSLAADSVVSIINVGEFRPRQLMVTKDGEIIGGELDKAQIAIELSSGQVTQVPIAQISRVGYRKRPGEPEEWTFNKPMVVMRTGERMIVKMPEKKIDVVTRYGTLSLDPRMVNQIAFQSEDNGVHTITLSDTSHFAGLVSSPSFEMVLADSGQTVQFPAASIDRIQLAPAPEDQDQHAGTMTLLNSDTMVGGLTGTLKLNTAFSALTVNAQEIKKLVHSKTAVQDVQVVLWDETSVSGELDDPTLTCVLASGVEMKIPVALVDEYENPNPRLPDAMVKTVEKMIGDLNSEDGRVRDDATKKLKSMGNIVAGTLKNARGSAPVEAQRRIDEILKTVGEPTSRPATVTPGGAGPQDGVIMQPQFEGFEAR